MGMKESHDKKTSNKIQAITDEKRSQFFQYKNSQNIFCK